MSQHYGQSHEGFGHQKPDTSELLHHSDRGWLYTSGAFPKIMRTTNITCSMSRTGCCYDNAVVDRFFWSLKHEWAKFEEFEDLADARLCVCKYIETFYNSERIHQTLDYQAPDEFGRKYRAALAVHQKPVSVSNEPTQRSALLLAYFRAYPNSWRQCKKMRRSKGLWDRLLIE